MTTTQHNSLLKTIANTIADYREGEIAQITPDHIERWAYQFDKDERFVILSEMAHLLTRYYISRKQVQDYIRSLLKSTNIFGPEPIRMLPHVHFLNIQRKGSSQSDLLRIVQRHLQNDYNLSITYCGKDTKIYIYLDDCLFSGNTAIYDIKDWLPQAINGTNLFLIFFAAHSRGIIYLQQRLAPITRKYSITTNYRGVRILQNNTDNIENFECFWPQKVIGVPLVDHYIESLIQKCQGKSFTPRIFRSADVPGQETVFSSPAARTVIERAFLRAGAYIVSLSADSKWQIRPMGYEYLESLGFGALVITYRNISNNCPLALWWGDADAPATHPLSKWYPLFPRKANTVASWIDG